MSTRSILAVPDGDAWKGRYCHSDGYPTHNARELWALVQRDGLEAVQTMLTETWYGWSYISAGMPSIAGVTPDPNADYGTPAYYAHHFTAGYQADGRFACVPGYGTAYTTEQGQSNPDEWITPDDVADSWCEWLYVVSPGGLIVGMLGDTVTYLGMYRWDQAEPDWSKVECGEQFERCGHYAYYHFPELVGTDRDRMETAEYLASLVNA